MRVPDEALYKKGQKRIEDIPGFVFCPHCNRCTITHPDQIFTDGAFYCLHRGEWKRGDDIVEYLCEGYRIKSCTTCTKHKDCTDKGEGVQFCRQFKCRGVNHPGMYFMGRRNRMQNLDHYALLAEETYIEYKRRVYEHQRSGREKTREYQQDKERDAELGNLQIPDPNEENKVDISSEEEDS